MNRIFNEFVIAGILLKNLVPHRGKITVKHRSGNAKSSNLPTSVAHVTSHRTISRRRQFSVESVIRITCELLGHKQKTCKEKTTNRYR